MCTLTSPPSPQEYAERQAGLLFWVEQKTIWLATLTSQQVRSPLQVQ